MNFPPDLLQYLIVPIFILCLIFSCSVLKYIPNTNQKFDSINRSSPLDGLRGILALSVLVHHFYITYAWKTEGFWIRPESNLLNNLGSISVSLFFLITGFLFFNKIKNKNIDWKRLYISRFKRIIPLYVFVFIFIVLITLNSVNISNGFLFDFLKWFVGWLFFNGGSLNGFNSSLIIAGVNWTLIYEWGFYFSLPIFYALIHKRISEKLFFYLCAFIFLLIFLTTKRSHYLLFLFSYFAIFYDFKIVDMIKNKKMYINLLIPTLILVGLFFTNAYSFIQKVLCGIVFAFMANGYSFFGILESKGLKILGDISYSIYLVHGLVLYTLFSILGIFDFGRGLFSYYILFPLVFFVVIIFSFFTYSFVEKPFLKK
ncbi:acyltransferase family protein [Acinetobacter sp. CAAS 2-6]|uniref:acyltransferase family protein n=1 Tax=Acinetobacter sp. CAAS 2-6 TaxID=3016358 RepID=UPI002DD618FB|nr:acyltransferase [Acinetobacter sp. CAAS 2-6]